ncbi:hypothetical protein [Pseudomonas quasicaspiana]|uniref:hypothetical protein n=1 Tax=Pseudomonas quasicaspiana TaxID=2829821 RepID=UPI001E40BC9C|nr:hypothetical protein [Pseudomonas quasicaspiana]MCD5973947.1 hypothetical protein [Pseudomonas quasicaspiana]
MSYDKDNVLFLALANDEFDKFLAGEPYYFLATKDDNDEPQNVIVAFKLLFMPYWREVGDPDFPAKFAQALIKMLETYPDQNRAIYMAECWLWCYRFCLSKKYAQPDGPYAGLFEFDMSAVAAVLKAKLEANKSELMADTRWAGATWNSQNGLWEPLIREAIVVRDELGGPDYVPNNI